MTTSIFDQYINPKNLFSLEYSILVFSTRMGTLHESVRGILETYKKEDFVYFKVNLREAAMMIKLSFAIFFFIFSTLLPE